MDLTNVFGPLMAVLMACLYGFIIWLIYKIAMSLVGIRQSMEEVTHILREGMGRRNEPPR